MKTSQPRRFHLRLGLCLAVLAMLAACSSPPPVFKASEWPTVRDRYITRGIAVGVTVSGNYAYVADFDEGLQVIDVRNPAKAVRVGGYVRHKGDR